MNCVGSFGCENDATAEKHACPYGIVIEGDRTKSCNCCESCKSVCYGMIPEEKLPQIPKRIRSGK